MRVFLYRCAAIALLWLLLQLCLSSCAVLPRDEPFTPADSLLSRQLSPGQLSTGRIKFKGPVTLQIGGSGNTGSATDATRAKAPVAAAPHAVASQTKTSAGTPWWVFAGLVVIGMILGAWVGGKFAFLSFLK